MLNFTELSENIIHETFKYKKNTPNYTKDLKTIFFKIEKETHEKNERSDVL